MMESKEKSSTLEFFTAMGTTRRHREWCVEVAFSDKSVLVRDTKDKGSGPTLQFTDAEWQAFIEGVKNGEFDLPETRTKEALNTLGPVDAFA